MTDLGEKAKDYVTYSLNLSRKDGESPLFGLTMDGNRVIEVNISYPAGHMIRVGDEILSINGVNTTNLDHQSINNLLTLRKFMILTLRRSSKY